jgi:hypothetical protein
MFPGFGVISAKTQFPPVVHAEDVSILDPMQWSPLIYTGQRVNVLVDCYEYDNAGNKGIGTGLQGLQIITSAGAQRLQIGGGSGPDTTGAFGGQPAQAAPQAVPQPGMVPYQQPVPVAPAAAPAYAPPPVQPVVPAPVAAPVYPGQPVVQQAPAGVQQVQPQSVIQQAVAPIPAPVAPVAAPAYAPQQQGFIPNQ